MSASVIKLANMWPNNYPLFLISIPFDDFYPFSLQVRNISYEKNFVGSHCSRKKCHISDDYKEMVQKAMIPRTKQVLQSGNGERVLNMVITFRTLPYVKLYVNYTLNTLNYFGYIAKKPNERHKRVNVENYQHENKSSPNSLPAVSL